MNEVIVSGMINAITRINNYLFPFSIIIPISLGIVYLICTALSFKHNMTIYFNVLIGLCYFYAGFPLLFTYKQLGINAYIGGSILLLFSMIFFFLLFSLT